MAKRLAVRGISTRIIGRNQDKLDATLANFDGFHPCRRIGEPDDTAKVADFLLDDITDWETGAVLGH